MDVLIRERFLNTTEVDDEVTPEPIPIVVFQMNFGPILISQDYAKVAEYDSES